MKRTIIKQVPADHSPESIKDVMTIVIIDENRGMGHVDTTIVHLEGTVEEKLVQYKEATGDDWQGHDEQVFSEYDLTPVTSLGLGKIPDIKTLCEVDKRIQDKIDAIVKENDAWLKEFRLEKHREKLLKTRERMKQEVL